MEKFLGRFNPEERSGLPIHTEGELRLAQEAARKAIQEKQKEAKKEAEIEERFRQSRIRHKEEAEKKPPVHEITEKDIEEAEKMTGRKLH